MESSKTIISGDRDDGLYHVQRTPTESRALSFEMSTDVAQYCCEESVVFKE